MRVFEMLITDKYLEHTKSNHTCYIQNPDSMDCFKLISYWCFEVLQPDNQLPCSMQGTASTPESG
ncbi:hypothetical protein BANRA_00063 [Escherichia coli]|nr:hypothetical protein BANRA_00063 [Escherichia coli]